MKEPITIEEVSDSISTESNEQTVLENKHATKSEKLKEHISIETSLADGQTKPETYGRRKLEKVTVSKAPQEAIETMCTSMSQENQVVDEVKSEKVNAKRDLEPIHGRSYTVDEMTSNEKEEQFEQKQPKQEKANKNRDSKSKNVVTKKETNTLESVLSANIDSHMVNDAKPATVQEEIKVPLTIEEVSDNFSTESNEQKITETKYATKSEALKEHISIEANQAESQIESETYGTEKPEKITVSKAPKHAIETTSTSLLEQNQAVNKGKTEKVNAKRDFEPIHGRSYDVVEMTTNDKEVQFEQKQSIHKKANKSNAFKTKNVVTKKKTDTLESMLPVNVDSHRVSNIEPVSVQEEIKVPLTIEEVSDSISTESNEQTVLENKHATKSEKLKEHISMKTNLTSSQTKSETFGMGKSEKITVSKAPQ